MAVAEAYLGSFRPVQPVPGFENVLSTIGMNALGSIPAAKAKMEAELAAAALNELGANARLEQSLEATARENELTRAANRRTGAMRMAGDLLASSLGGLSSSAGVEVGDPLALIERLGQFQGRQSQDRAGQTLRSNAFAKGLFDLLGS